MHVNELAENIPLQNYCKDVSNTLLYYLHTMRKSSGEYELCLCLKTRGYHFIVKLNTTCEQSLLPLYYMPYIIYDVFPTYT